MIQKILFGKMLLYVTVTFFIIFSSCGLHLEVKPLATMLEKTGEGKAGASNSKVVFRFFDEDFVSGGYQYGYPEASRVFIPEGSGHASEAALQFDLEPGDYSGGAVCLYNLLYDLTPCLATGALEFWIKGNEGGEIAWIALVDDEKSDGKKTVVRVALNKYGRVTREWRHVSIPLVDFGKRGVYWDPKKRIEIINKFDWDQVAEFRIEIKKGDNKNFRVWVDDIFICKDVYGSQDSADGPELVETIESPPLPDKSIKPVKCIFRNDFSADGFAYVYGGKTTYRVQKGTSKEYSGVLACYEDNDEYSGVTLSLGIGNFVNLEPLRKAKAAGLGFWAKGGPGTSTVCLGLLDNEGNDKKVQTKLLLGDFGKIDTTWHYFMAPLRKFSDKGKYWDANKKTEILADVNWKLINEIRFSTNKGENKVEPGQPVKLYVEDMAIIESIPGYVDPDEYWKNFKSNEPDLVLHDFETAPDQTWTTGAGPASQVHYDIAHISEPGCGKKSLEISYHLVDWCDVMYDYRQNGISLKKRDWTRYWGIKFMLYAEKPYQGLNVQINDSGNEIFIASCGGARGWSEVLVPFRDFSKFPYYQPPDAIQNGKFDLDCVVKIDIKPAGEGSSARFMVDNITLTNARELKIIAPPAEKEVTISGSFATTVTERINDGIFGINAQHWDGDLLLPKTAEYVKAVGHRVIRFPGGLSADEYHWRKMLDSRDDNVDIDEFLDFCRKTDCEPMLTANFGTGTAREAADWVHYVNIEKKANVRFWEVGNELYGDWHAKHCSAEEYGKRAAEYIKEMKKVDPAILITVVWRLEGDWNKTVFDYTKDLADGINVHNYPQVVGQENDEALLAAPQSMEDIIGSIRRQIKGCGIPGKKYQIWLTEWNSVNFNPGPQSLGIVNALFVADYLGMLAKLNIDQASYWNIHNYVFERGGDYGYLTHSDVPEGPNIPRPSYWAFKLAGESLRGKLVECTVSDNHVSSYLSIHKDGAKSLLLINKYRATTAEALLGVSGFSGNGTMMQLTKETGRTGYDAKPCTVSQGMKLKLPPYSMTEICVK